MKILVCEYITASGLEPEAQALLSEGNWMALSLVRDLNDVSGVRADLMRARSAGPAPLDRERVRWVEPPDSFWEALLRSVNDYDAVWPIAPETDGLLERLSAWILNAGGTLLSSPPAGVRLAASKKDCFERLDEHGIPVVPTQSLVRSRMAPPFAFPIVIKPDDGVGCEGLSVLEHPTAYARFLEDHPEGNWIVQPWLAGDPISYSALFLRGRGVLLTCNRQHLMQTEGGLHLAAIEVNALADPEGHHVATLQKIASALPELWGYAGVDLIVKDGQPTVLEVNPRLTSAYPALYKALGENPAALALDLYHLRQLPPQRALVNHSVWAQW